MIKLYPKTILIATLLLSSPSLNAAIYTFVDENGVSHFSNVPNDTRYRLFYKGTAKSLMGNRQSQKRPSTNFFANRKRFESTVSEVALKYNVDSALVHAIISAESGYNPNAISPKGAVGLMQLMPATARRYGVVNIHDPKDNIHGGVRYIRDLLQLFKNDIRLAIAAYNAGENAVAKYGNRIPPYAETINYVPKVLNYYHNYRKHSASLARPTLVADASVIPVRFIKPD